MSEEFRVWADIFRKKPFTVDGKEIELLSIQKSKRTQRAGRTNYIYHIIDTNIIMVNFNPDHPYWMKMGPASEMDRYFKVFTERPVSKQSQEWLDLNGYELI